MFANSGPEELHFSTVFKGLLSTDAVNRVCWEQDTKKSCSNDRMAYSLNDMKKSE